MGGLGRVSEPRGVDVAALVDGLPAETAGAVGAVVGAAVASGASMGELRDAVKEIL
jgi:hypothetical protein